MVDRLKINPDVVPELVRERCFCLFLVFFERRRGKTFRLSNLTLLLSFSLPLQPLGFIQVDLNGTVVKVPYYAV